MIRAGQVVFDAEAALERDENEEMPPPPPYSELNSEAGREEARGKASAFVLEDDEGSSDDEAHVDKIATRKGKTQELGIRHLRAGPSLLTRHASKSSAGAEIDVAPQSADGIDAPISSTSDTSLTSFRRRVDPHTHTSPISDASASSSLPSDGQTCQYWLRKPDTLQSIAIRFAVSTNELCLLNSLPCAVLSTSPHLLHTRPFILLPAKAVEKQLASNPGLMRSLQGPPQKSAREKTTGARKTAEAKFRATLSKDVVEHGETAADEKAARAYIGLAEDEFRTVDFGEGLDEDGLPFAYDNDMDDSGEDMEMVEAQMDTARRLRFEAILKHALAKWEMDSDWERRQRANGIDPSTISKPVPPSSASASHATNQEQKRANKVGSWFTRALNANRGERSPSQRPRHVVALSSLVKLPTHISQTFSEAHRGPVNVARYNTLGRYLLTGGSDRSIRLWNGKSGGEAIKTYTEHSYEVLALDISRDNSRFVSGGADRSVYVWDVGTGSVVRRLSGHVGKVNDVRFAGKDGDGSVVVVGSGDGVVRVFDLRAQGAWRPIMELKDAKDAVTTLAVREDSILSASVDGVLRWYDLRSGQLRSDTFAAPITSIAPSRLGTSVLVATLDSTIRLLDTKDGTLLQEYKGHKNGLYRCRAIFANDEDGVVAGDENGDLVGWDTVSGERIKVGASEGKAHVKPILWVESNPDASAGELVSAGADGTVKVWSLC